MYKIETRIRYNASATTQGVEWNTAKNDVAELRKLVLASTKKSIWARIFG